MAGREWLLLAPGETAVPLRNEPEKREELHNNPTHLRVHRKDVAVNAIHGRSGAIKYRAG
jgi:hypothetical protein